MWGEISPSATSARRKGHGLFGETEGPVSSVRFSPRSVIVCFGSRPRGRRGGHRDVWTSVPPLSSNVSVTPLPGAGWKKVTRRRQLESALSIVELVHGKRGRASGDHRVRASAAREPPVSHPLDRGVLRRLVHDGRRLSGHLPGAWRSRREVRGTGPSPRGWTSPRRCRSQTPIGPSSCRRARASRSWPAGWGVRWRSVSASPSSPA